MEHLLKRTDGPVQDIDRPDVHGTPPKMQEICNQVAEALEGIAPVLKVRTDDNFCSSVDVTGSLDPRDAWPMNILQNSRHFRFSLEPPKGARYWQGGDKVTIELQGAHYEMTDAHPFRKSTTTIPKAIERIKKWLGLFPASDQS